jgi:hypothetical protein
MFDHRDDAIGRLELLIDFLDRADITIEQSVEYIKQQQINQDSMAHHAGVLAVCRVRWFRERRFAFADDGMMAAVLTALDENKIIADLIAWPVGRPDKFAPALGCVAILGLDQIDGPETWDGHSLIIHRSPLRWLQHRCRGVVAVNEQAASLYLGGALGQLIGEDRIHAREMTKSLRRPVDPPFLASQWNLREAA